MMKNTPRLALFDLDLTVLSVNSVRDWIRNERQQGRVSALQALRAAVHLFRYRYAGADVSGAISRGISHLKGEKEEDFRQRTREFWLCQMSEKIRPGAIECIEEHRHVGDHIALLTSSSVYLAEEVAAHLAIPHVLAMRFDVQDGCFTGLPILPLCHGAGKVILAERLALQLGVSMQNAVFYTDSMSDLPTLEKVGTPVLVHPDPRLRQVGIARNWQIVTWD